MARFRKKPIVVEAQQFHVWDDNLPPNVHKRYPDGDEPTKWHGARVEFYVITVHGQEALLQDGDWVIQEPLMGRAYPCKDDIFKATYEPVEG
jgi:hypothetical protein